MDAETWRRVEELFHRAVALPPAERAALLDDACGDDRELRAGVESLLEHDARAGQEFLATPVVVWRRTQDDSPDWAQKLVGRQVGRYTVVRVLGHGGMGCVFEARQDRPTRPVALKVLQPGLSASAALARFRLEPELLARLQHPNIAQVYEAGVHEDENGVVPYFAMEYIPEARPLLDYAAAKKLTTRQRLELFAKVCDAVEHGHQKGIVHRDLKPANILVGDLGEPKVIDFGVARATDVDIQMTTQCTQVGDLVGTVRYMSPEQCDGDPAAIDTRSDIYSLGVVLYELLTGGPPYDTAGTTLYHAIRVIKEQAPHRPSTVTGPDGRPARHLRGDVEAILLKALEKDPARRYRSAGDLAADIRRHLAGEPVAAKPPTAWTRMTRWALRHPRAAAAGAGGLIIIASLLLTYVQVWYLALRPHKIEIAEDRKQAALLSAAGHRLKTWETKEDRIVFGELVRRPPELGGGLLALLGFGDVSEYAYGNCLVAFDANGDLDEPVWVGRIDPNDPVPDPHGRGYTGANFDFFRAWLFDVFTDETSPGDEVVAAFVARGYSQLIIRVYDLGGEVLYEVWHDGVLSDAYWSAEARQLVFVGETAVRGYLWELGWSAETGERCYPVVVFAIQPKYGARLNGLLSATPGPGALDPLWLRCVYPSSPIRQLTVTAPFDKRGKAIVHVSVEPQPDIKLGWNLDAGGNVVGDKVVSDGYKQNQALAMDDPRRSPVHWDEWELRDLPPIQPAASQPATQPSP